MTFTSGNGIERVGVRAYSNRAHFFFLEKALNKEKNEVKSEVYQTHFIAMWGVSLNMRWGLRS